MLLYYRKYIVHIVTLRRKIHTRLSVTKRLNLFIWRRYCSLKLFFSILISVVLVSLFHANIAIAKDSTVINTFIDEDSTIIDAFEMLYYNDPTGSLDINDIIKLDFNKTLSNAFALNHTQGKDWFKITLVNNSNNEEFLLHMNDVWWYELNLYSFENNNFIKVENGLQVILKDKKIKNTDPTFDFHINKGQRKTFYIEGKALLGSTQKFTIYTDKDLYLENQLLSIGLYMFYIGAAFVVVILNLFLFLTLRESIYIYYSLYVFTFSMIMITIEGVIEYLFPLSYYALHFFAPLSIAFLILFSREILETSKHTPKSDKLLILLAAVMFIFTFLLYIDPLAWFMLYNNILPLPPFVIFFAAIISWKNANSDARYYLFFMIFYIIALFIFAFLSLNIVKYNDFTRYAYIFTSFFEMTLFSLVLANRFNRTKNEKNIIEIDLKNTKELSLRDSLTNLHNRHHLESYANTCFDRAKREQEEVSVIMLDIDHFKSVNDTYGHGVGDMVLKNIAAILTSSTRQGDEVIRYGGEEFIIILPSTKFEDAQALAEKIRVNIEKMKSNYEENKELSVTTSLGVSLLKEDDSSMKSVISRADEALYKSKRSGRNRVSILK